MSPGRALQELTGRGFPRVSGDEPYLPEVEAFKAAFSPRERG